MFFDSDKITQIKLKFENKIKLLKIIEMLKKFKTDFFFIFLKLFY